MKNHAPYLRIGTKYYKKANVPLMSGDTIKALLPWSKQEIITDHGKDYLQNIPKYDGFCNIPSHTNYQAVIKGFRNRYEPIEIEPIDGPIDRTLNFMEHIFGDQLDLGLDYLQLLWQHPTQRLPILCLVSSERNTGKTTYLNWMRAIFQYNMSLVTNEDLRSRFNSDWIPKLLIGVDETLLAKQEDTEKLKNLTTAKYYKLEAKGKDRSEVPCFIKIILCSNNELDFMKISMEETRFWVRKIPSLQPNQDNPDLLEELQEEIPHFIYYLGRRSMSTSRKSRMWFTPDQIHTEALEIVKRGSRTTLIQEIEEILREDFVRFETEILKYSASDLVEKLSKNNVRVSAAAVAKSVRKNYGIQAINSSYQKYHLAQSFEGNSVFVGSSNHKGRHFVFEKAKMSDFLLTG